MPFARAVEFRTILAALARAIKPGTILATLTGAIESGPLAPGTIALFAILAGARKTRSLIAAAISGVAVAIPVAWPCLALLPGF
jgi:hypothetical protein